MSAILLHQTRRPRIDRDAKQMWQAALRYSALGLEMGVAVAIGYALGWWLDARFGTQPWLTLIGLLLGIAAGFRGLIRAAREIMRENEREETTGSDGEGDGDKGERG